MNFKRILTNCISFCLMFLFMGCSSTDDSSPNAENGLITPTLEPTFESLKGSRLAIDASLGKVSWTNDDQLLVFVHESGKQPTNESEWKVCKYKFVTNANDCAKSKFAQEPGAQHPLLLDPTKSYDWYVMYPYNETIQSPLGIGHISITDQTMDMQAPTAHLGAFDIMSNTLKNQQAAQQVNILLNHHATLMQFTVYNLTSESFLPKSLEFETNAATPAAISGTFNVNFEKGLSELTGSNKLCLELNQAQDIAPNGSFTVYTIMSPFSLNTGDQFNIRVITDKSNTVQSSTMRAPITFKAGTKSTAKVKVTPAPIINQDIEGWNNQEIEGWEDQGNKNDFIN